MVGRSSCNKAEESEAPSNNYYSNGHYTRQPGSVSHSKIGDVKQCLVFQYIYNSLLNRNNALDPLFPYIERQEYLFSESFRCPGYMNFDSKSSQNYQIYLAFVPSITTRRYPLFEICSSLQQVPRSDHLAAVSTIVLLILARKPVIRPAHSLWGHCARPVFAQVSSSHGH